ncbi:MAG: cytochrome c biogenesis protein ResB [Kiritimatiellales bacterium]|nr:cytochrome c biogenesis protein ResB [Kiritimatiellales bacterium]
MTTSIYIFIALILFFIAGAFPVGEAEAQIIIFKTPVFILLMATLAVLILQCCWQQRRGFKLRKIGFQLTHLGAVVILVGAFLGFIVGKRTNFAIPLTKHAAADNFQTGDGGTVKFDFKLAASGFKVEFFAKQYNLYKAPATKDADYDYVDKFRIPSSGDVLDLGNYGTVKLEDLRQSMPSTVQGIDPDWKQQHLLPDGSILQLVNSAPRHYEAMLHMTDKNSATTDKKLMVNHPVSYGGWRFYLMSYDQQMKRYIVVSARNDPGRNLVIAGLWMMIVGVFVICFVKAEGTRK